MESLVRFRPLGEFERELRALVDNCMPDPMLPRGEAERGLG